MGCLGAIRIGEPNAFRRALLTATLAIGASAGCDVDYDSPSMSGSKDYAEAVSKETPNFLDHSPASITLEASLGDDSNTLFEQSESAEYELPAADIAQVSVDTPRRIESYIFAAEHGIGVSSISRSSSAIYEVEYNDEGEPTGWGIDVADSRPILQYYFSAWNTGKSVGSFALNIPISNDYRANFTAGRYRFRIRNLVSDADDPQETDTTKRGTNIVRLYHMIKEEPASETPPFSLGEIKVDLYIFHSRVGSSGEQNLTPISDSADAQVLIDDMNAIFNRAGIKITLNEMIKIMPAAGFTNPQGNDETACEAPPLGVPLGADNEDGSENPEPPFFSFPPGPDEKSAGDDPGGYERLGYFVDLMGGASNFELFSSRFACLARWAGVAEYEEANGKYATYKSLNQFKPFLPASADRALNLYVFPTLLDLDDVGSLGSDGVISGPGYIEGTSASGVIAEGKRFDPDNRANIRLLASILAHRIGHYAGLYHTSEKNGYHYGPVRDTPVCSAGVGSSVEACQGAGADYLMFWEPDREKILEGGEEFVLADVNKISVQERDIMQSSMIVE